MFQKSEGTTVQNMYSGNALFSKFWLDSQGIGRNTKASVLPGNKEGITASVLGGINAGINKYITKEQKDAAGIVVKYMTSYEGQKKYILQSKDLSAINSLYDDEEVCKINDCELMKEIQPIARQSTLTDNYDNYSKQFRNNIYKFLYEDGDAYEALQNIEDIVKKYNVKLTDNEGLIILIVTVVVATLMLTSLMFIFMKKYRDYFDFMNANSWFMIFFGFLLILSVIFTQYNSVSKNVCHLKLILNSFGFTFINIPILHGLIINFPKEIKVFEWIRKNQFKFILFFLFYDLIVNASLNISSFQVKVQTIVGGKNFEICKINKKTSMVIAGFIIAEKLLIMVAISLFLFLEWNLKRTRKDILLITSAQYINILSFALIIILQKSENNNYKLRFLLFSIFNLTYVFSQYLFIYGLRIIFILININNEEEFDTKEYSTPSTAKPINSSETSIKSDSFENVFLKYHFYTGEENKKNNTVYGSSSLRKNQNDQIKTV